MSRLYDRYLMPRLRQSPNQCRAPQVKTSQAIQFYSEERYANNHSGRSMRGFANQIVHPALSNSRLAAGSVMRWIKSSISYFLAEAHNSRTVSRSDSVTNK